MVKSKQAVSIDFDTGTCCSCYAWLSKGALGSGAQKKQAQKKEGRRLQHSRSKFENLRANQHYEETLKFLEQVPLLKRLPRDDLPIVACCCMVESFNAGDQVISQGEVGTEFFVIRAGEASIYVRQEDGTSEKVSVLRSGDYFGEKALLDDEPRMATVIAEGGVLECYTISREMFLDLGLHDKLCFPRRQAVGIARRGPDCPDGGRRGVVKQEPSPKSEEDRDFIRKALESNQALQAMVKLDDCRIQRMTDAAWKQSVKQGELLIVENDPTADHFYIIHEGSFEILLKESDMFRRSSEDEVGLQRPFAAQEGGVRSMGPGDSFGELALLYIMPRTATVRATEESTVWVFDRESFKSILMRSSEEEIAQNRKLLDKVEILDPLAQEEKQTMAEALVEMHFEEGEVVAQQGEIESRFYIMFDGQVKVTQDGHVLNEMSAEPHGDVQFFGEKALLNDYPRTATVQVMSPVARMLVLDRATFDLIIGPLRDIISDPARPTQYRASSKHHGSAWDVVRNSLVNPDVALRKVSASSTASSSSLKATPWRRRKIEREKLVKIGLLGCGGFGCVELCEHTDTCETFAMKVMSKGYILQSGMKESVITERRILALMDSIFIIKLYETYNGPHVISFLMEPALGGELYATYYRKKFHGKEGHARYYSAGVISAFEYLHERRVVYRDLKPENLLLNEKGHLKLTDMGLAKFVIGRTYTTCGTPDYFAPEVITSAGHNKAVDWWGLGILIFELLTAHPPFESRTPQQTYAKVKKGIEHLAFPPSCRGHAEELVRCLLKQDPSARLPMRRGGADNLRRHPWFEGFDWESHAIGQMEAPYKPIVRSGKDLVNFNIKKQVDVPGLLDTDYWDDGSGWGLEM